MAASQRAECHHPVWMLAPAQDSANGFFSPGRNGFKAPEFSSEARKIPDAQSQTQMEATH